MLRDVGPIRIQREHYEISLKIGEQALLPAVRKAPQDAIIAVVGFSCREQIAHTTDRRGLHLAQILRMAMHDETAVIPRSYPESWAVPDQRSATRGVGTVLALGAGGLGILGASAALRSGKRHRR